MGERRVAVVGGGIVGLAVARELVRRHPGAAVVVLEKEDRLGAHQTGHNSGVVHAGIYYRPGSLKARLCARGRDLLADYCAEHALPYRECGKLVVAVDETERGCFEALQRTAEANRVPGLRRVEGAGIAEIEPHATGLVALHSPRTAITDYTAVADQLGQELRAAGGRVRLGTRVTGVQRRSGSVLLGCADADGTTSPEVADHVVLCAGLQADRLGRLAGGSADPRIVPFRGEYLEVCPDKADLVRGMVYPVPDPRYPFLGVHWTRRVDGGLEVGPNAVLAPAREGYRRRDARPGDLAETLAWPGTWQLARQHWRTGVREVAGSLSTRAYLRSARRYVPEIGPADVRRAGAGVRAQAVGRDGSLLDDFRIDGDAQVTSVRNAPSPAATSSLAIAEHVVEAITLRP
ncbi:L-2-hydroxyglutarate oxidase [Janibacter alkaliphilus]|uniref:L-2-hydroxyglutarate oxidase LhgO n=1 Tax=Janibacter alkaliphilus TaxID=1069963 RepID=A0A852XD92_9MICO|nr:L-2-hydroxyglutarate oxidase LhgO [Janibacter alkaliphilus]